MNLHLYPSLTPHRYRTYAEKLRPLVKDTVPILTKALRAGKNVVVEGANAAMLDIDFGTYPFVTSSNCSIGGVLTGLGIPPQYIGEVFGVFKAYLTRVGTGPFPTEQLNVIGDTLQERGHEIGVTTKRRRRCGWLDLELLKYTTMVNGYTALCMTKLDILDTFEKIMVGVSYTIDGKPLESFPSQIADLARVEVVYKEMDGWLQDTTGIRDFAQLPQKAQDYVRFCESQLQVPIKWVGVGQGRESIIEVY